MYKELITSYELPIHKQNRGTKASQRLVLCVLTYEQCALWIYRQSQLDYHFLSHACWHKYKWIHKSINSSLYIRRNKSNSSTYNEQAKHPKGWCIHLLDCWVKGKHKNCILFIIMLAFQDYFLFFFFFEKPDPKFLYYWKDEQLTNYRVMLDQGSYIYSRPVAHY